MEVTLIDSMGTDLSVVNAARVSFGKKGELEPDGSLSKTDTNLIKFLARGCTSSDWENIKEEFTDFYGTEGMDDLLKQVKNMPTHWTPFGHTAITLHIKAPIFVARQLGKHQVGFVWNEVSRRYVTDEPEFYNPTLRLKADNVKQGSSDQEVDDVRMYKTLRDSENVAYAAYSTLILNGVAPEQARMVLPQSMYTEWYWTGNLYGFANVFIQRSDSHAQKEVRDVAKQIGDIIQPLFPVSWEALTK